MGMGESKKFSSCMMPDPTLSRSPFVQCLLRLCAVPGGENAGLNECDRCLLPEVGKNSLLLTVLRILIGYESTKTILLLSRNNE